MDETEYTKTKRFKKLAKEYLENDDKFMKTKLTAEPILIRAGDQRVKLGFNNSHPKVDCRVLSEEKYQELLGSVNAYKEELRKEIEERLLLQYTYEVQGLQWTKSLLDKPQDSKP